MTKSRTGQASHFSTASAVLGAAVLAGALISFGGWVLDIPRLTDWGNTGVSIQPNTSVLISLSGLGLILHRAGRTRAAGFLGALVALISGLTLLQYFIKVDLGFNHQLMFGRTWGQFTTLTPGRMGPPASTSLMLIGTSLVILGWAGGKRGRQRWTWLVPLLAVPVSAVTLFSVIGYAFGADPFYTLPWLTAIALQTALMLMALSVSLLLAVPDRQPVLTLRERSAAGSLARIVLPVLVLAPVLASALRSKGQEAALYDPHTGRALSVLAVIVVTVSLMWWALMSLRRRERNERAAERRVSDILGSITDAFYVLDESFRFAFVNDEILARFHLRRPDLLGRRPWDVLPEAIGNEPYVQLHRAMSERVTVQYDYAVGHRWFLERAYPTAEGGLAVHSQDITERKQAQRKISESEARFRTMADFSPVMIWVTNPAGEIEFVNRAYQHFFGLTEAELRGGGGWQALIHPDDHERYVGGFLQAVRDRCAFECECRVRHATGEWRWIASYGAARFSESGEFLGHVGSSPEISELKKAEQARGMLLESERAARAEAEQANRIKDEFLATLSHELRTPLNAILGWVRLIEKNPADAAIRAEGIPVIARNAKIQLDLISDLLETSRIVSGKIRLQLNDLDLVDVVQTAVEAARPTAAAKGISLVLSTEDSVVLARGDASRLQQVVWNLLSNAVKFTPARGRIDVALCRSGPTAKIVVMDNGAGINREFLPHLFERFRQADGSAARKFGGLGLGLSIVKQLVELHGGSVRGESEGEGQGATFTIELPLLNADDAENLETQPPSAKPCSVDYVDLTGLKLVTIEDQADAAAMVRRVLEDCGAKVFLANSADQGLRLVDEEQPDAVLCDIGLPGKDGFAFIRELRASGNQTPVIAVTAFARPEDKLQILRMGFQAHVPKPIEPAELVSIIARVVPSETGVGSNVSIA